jgi:hypothetical protein
MSNQIKEEVEKYQWIKGDNQGTVEVVKSTDGKFILFKSGKRCNHAVLGEFMMKIDLENPVLHFDDPLAASAVPNKTVAKPVESEYVAKAGTHNIKSPIIPLLEKAKTKKTKLNTRIQMDLPSKEFIDVLQNSWDEDILTIQAEYIVSKIEDPKEFLIEKIKVALSEWFYTSPKTNRSKK